MKRNLEITETGQFRSLYAAPEHKSRKDPGATAESLSPLIVEPVPPTWRDLWAILRKRYEPKLRVRLQMGVAAMDFILAETWTNESLEEQLHSSHHLFDALEDRRVD